MSGTARRLLYRAAGVREQLSWSALHVVVAENKARQTLQAEGRALLSSEDRPCAGLWWWWWWSVYRESSG